MKYLFLIPSIIKPLTVSGDPSVPHPLMDYHALADRVRAHPGSEVELLDYAAVAADRNPAVRMARRLAGKDAALALMGMLRSRNVDAIFTNGENVAIPLALLLKIVRRRPGHITIGHRLSTGKKALFFRLLRTDRQIDTIFVYARTQLEHARDRLRIPEDKLSLIAFHADTRFYRPLEGVAVDENQVCAAGLEWRDYPTLIDAVAQAPELKVRLAAASPWSKHADETARRPLPPNVAARRYEYHELRELYAQSAIVAVPLYENDFQAGITTLLEAMAMGKPVVVTRTTGQQDVVTDGENGLMVDPGDIKGWSEAIERLRGSAELRERLGRAAQRWVETHATLDLWTRRIAGALAASAGRAGEEAPAHDPGRLGAAAGDCEAAKRCSSRSA